LVSDIPAVVGNVANLFYGVCPRIDCKSILYSFPVDITVCNDGESNDGGNGCLKAVLWIRIRRIRKFLGLLDAGPSLFVWIRIWFQIRIKILSPTSKKKLRKTFIFTILRHLFDFLSLRTAVNVP
jgi:hypothetical protein